MLCAWETLGWLDPQSYWKALGMLHVPAHPTTCGRPFPIHICSLYLCVMDGTKGPWYLHEEKHQLC